MDGEDVARKQDARVLNPINMQKVIGVSLEGIVNKGDVFL